MNEKDFQKVVDGTIDQVMKTLAAKGDEYVPEKATSRFHNFEVSAALNQQLPTEALWGFLTKHIVSLSDMVKIDSADTPMAKWDEKINDAIIYLLLLKGIVTSQKDVLPKTKGKADKGIVIHVDEPNLPPLIIHTTK